MKVSQLFVYPIKSLGGVSLKSAEITDRGLKFDRRWMLIDEANRFISQRTVAQLALIKVELEEVGLKVFHIEAPQDSLLIPYDLKTDVSKQVEIWDDTCLALHLDATFDKWFSSKTGMNCTLVYMPENSHRFVTPPHRNNDEINSFSDSYPFLMIGEKSLENLNSRMENDLPMNRFRPNIVFSGGEPYVEDTLAWFKINKVNFYGVKLSARCNLPTINQENATAGKEPIKTLSAYRKMNNKIYFGQNLVHEGQGTISVGDAIEVLSTKESPFSSPANR